MMRMAVTPPIWCATARVCALRARGYHSSEDYQEMAGRAAEIQLVEAFGGASQA